MVVFKHEKTNQPQSSTAKSEDAASWNLFTSFDWPCQKYAENIKRGWESTTLALGKRVCQRLRKEKFAAA